MTQRRTLPVWLPDRRTRLRKWPVKPNSFAGNERISTSKWAAGAATTDLYLGELARELLASRSQSPILRTVTEGCPLLTAQSTRAELFIVRARDSVGTVPMVDLSEDDQEDVHLANRLDCARCLVFAFAFEVAAVVAIWRCCNAHQLPHRLAAF
jgi:hypothetical protein